MLFLSPVPLFRLLMAAAAMNSSVPHLIVRKRVPEAGSFADISIKKMRSPRVTCGSMQRLAGVLKLSIKLMKPRISIVFVQVSQQPRNSPMDQLRHHSREKERER